MRYATTITAREMRRMAQYIAGEQVHRGDFVAFGKDGKLYCWKGAAGIVDGTEKIPTGAFAARNIAKDEIVTWDTKTRILGT